MFLPNVGSTKGVSMGIVCCIPSFREEFILGFRDGIAGALIGLTGIIFPTLLLLFGHWHPIAVIVWTAAWVFVTVGTGYAASDKPPQCGLPYALGFGILPGLFYGATMFWQIGPCVVTLMPLSGIVAYFIWNGRREA